MVIKDFIKGYVVIEVSGNYCERFLNLACKSGISVKNIKTTENEKVLMKIYIKDFFKIRSVARKSSCKVSIHKKDGLAVKTNKYRKRNTFVLGVILSVLLIFYLSNCILSVEISGNQKISTEVLKASLKEKGVKLFAGNNIKGKEIANEILNENPLISWAGVTVDGNKVIVEIVEKEKLPEIYNPEEKYNIVATTDGIISSYYLKKGFPVVKKGDTVKKGQLLVSGVTDSSAINVRYINPEADIKLVTWVTESSSESLVQNKDNLTNRSIKDTYLEINGKRYGITRKVPYKYYNVKTTEKTVIPFVKYIKVEKIENVPQKIVYNQKELFEIERKKLYNNIISKLSQEYKVLETKYEYILNDGEITTTVTCTIEGPYVEKITADN